MTRLYLDTEFNGYGGELISLALYEPASGRHFYEVLRISEPYDPWVAENVVPKLGREPMDAGIFIVELRAWLKRWRHPVIIADWPADLEHLFRSIILEGRWEVDIPLEAHLINSGQFNSADPHNALADARALAAWHIDAAARSTTVPGP